MRDTDVRVQELRALDAETARACGAYDELQQIALRKHHARMRLLESLHKRGVQPSPPDDDVTAWPWGPGAGRTGPDTPRLLDKGDTAEIVDDGYIVYTNINARPEVDAVLAARAFYQRFDDEYDFLVMFTNFPSELFEGRFLAYHIIVSNKDEGIGFKHFFGDEEFDIGPTFTQDDSRPSRLQSFLHLNDMHLYPESTEEPFFREYTYPAFIAHEICHRWGARMLVCTDHGGQLGSLLGRGNVHWSYFFNSEGSVLEGNLWDGQEPHFSTTTTTDRFGPLDLYLMGMAPLSEVPESRLFFLQDQTNCFPEKDLRDDFFNPGSPPQSGVSCDAARIDFTHDCLVAVNGPRRPAYPNTRRDFNAATIMVTLPDKPATSTELGTLDVMRQNVAAWFHEKTLQRGSLDFTLRQVPAEVIFDHRPHGDVEDPTQPVEITSGIRLRQRSLETTLEDLRFTLHYTFTGSDFVEVPMEMVVPAKASSGAETASEAIVRAMIPPPPDRGQVLYYIRSSTDLSAHEYTTPENAPFNTYDFLVRPDIRPPRITHAPVDSHSRNAEPAILRAVVLDEHGVRDVHVEYRLNDGPVHTLPLPVQGVTDVYESRFVLPGNVGDTVQYRIVATDVARTPHVAALPASGWFDLRVTLVQYENAEKDDPLWTHRSLKPFGVDEWHRQLIHNVTPGGKYSWKAGPDNLETNPRLGQTAYEQDAVLEGPAVRLGEGWELRFQHRYYLRTSPPDTDDSAVDGAVIQWQDADNTQHVAQDRWFLIDPVGGYPNQLGAYALFNPLQWWPAWSGDQDVFWPVRVDASVRPDFAGRLIRFRFRLVTSIPFARTEPGAGWYVDEIEIDPGTVVPVTLEELRAFRTDEGVTLEWRAADVERGDLFHIDRAAANARREPGVFAHQATLASTEGVKDYAWVDTDPESRSGAFVYRVRLVSNGVERLSRQVLVESVAPRFALHANRPNPFNPRTTITFDLPREQRARLNVYTVSGRHVKTLVDDTLASGPHRVVWDGTDQSGRAVASGLYLYRLHGDTRTFTRRMMLLR